jgi:glycosyltransferase involved in cell wall biosynthesis
MLKVVTIAQDLNPNYLGGAESHHVEVLLRLAKSNKYDLHVFVGISDKIKSILNHPNITVHAVNYPQITNLYSLSYLLFATPKIIKFCRAYKPDLLFAKEVFPLGIVGAVTSQFTKASLYITAQNPINYREEMVVTGGLAKACSKFLFPVFDVMASYAIKKAGTVAGISRYSVDLAKKMGAQRTIIIPNAVNPELLKLKKNKKPSPYFHIISTSKMIPRNGLDILVKALGLIKDPKIRLHLTSDGPMQSELKRLVTENNIQSQVTFYGPVSPKKILELLTAADIFVRPSRAEGLGTSFLEAMALGLPIIGTPVGGIPDFLFDGKTGLMAEVDSPESVAKQIIKLKSSPKLRATLSSNAKKLIESKYTWDQIAKAVDREFQLLLNAKRKTQKSKPQFKTKN